MSHRSSVLFLGPMRTHLLFLKTWSLRLSVLQHNRRHTIERVGFELVAELIQGLCIWFALELREFRELEVSLTVVDT